MQPGGSDNASAGVRGRVSAEEWATRVDLAACYRLVAHFGWDDLIFTHVSARVPGSHDFLINPFGLMFEEVTASNLVRVDLDGRKTLDSPHEINPAGYTIHSAIHAVREDVGCVLHLHTLAGIAVSAQKSGLLPLSQQATFVLLSLSYHDYEGLALNPEEKARLQADLGRTNNMILRNHGLLTAGRTIPDAFMQMYILQRACEIQLLAQGSGVGLIEIPPAILATVPAYVRLATLGGGNAIVWPALLRKMDRVDPSYKN